MTEVRPQIQIRGRKAGLEKSGTILYNACKALFDQEHMTDTIYRLCLHGMVFGSSFIGVLYDQDEEDIITPFVDPRRVFLDPGIVAAADIAKRSQYMRVDTILPLTEIRNRFPGRGSLVKPNEKYSTLRIASPQSRTSLISSVLSMMPRPYKPGPQTKAGPIPRSEIREYWIRDPHINTEGDPLFPGGRHIIRSGSIILVDEANPYFDGEWPYEMLEWDTDFDSPWGLDEINDLRRIQEAINRTGDSWVRNILLGSNFRVIGDIDALDPDQWEKLDNEAGLIIRKKPNRQLDYQPPLSPDMNMPQVIQSLITLCDMLVGNSDQQGKTPAGPSALEGLQTARNTITRMATRRLENTLERVGQKLISRIFQFYTGDKILFQQGPTREWIQYVYERQKLLEDDDGNPRPADQIQKMWKDYKFFVSPGSSLASARIQRVMALLQLRSATGGLVPVRRILQESDIGDADTLIAEALDELSKLPSPPPPKGRGGQS